MGILNQSLRPLVIVRDLGDRPRVLGAMKDNTAYKQGSIISTTAWARNLLVPEAFAPGALGDGKVTRLRGAVLPPAAPPVGAPTAAARFVAVTATATAVSITAAVGTAAAANAAAAPAAAVTATTVTTL